MDEFHKFVLPVKHAKNLSNKQWTDYFSADQDTGTKPTSDPVAPDADWCHMEQEVDGSGKPVEIDAEDFLSGKEQQQTKKQARRQVNLLATKVEKDNYVILAPHEADPYPDKIWIVKVMKVNDQPDDPRTFNNGHKWHYLGKWFAAEDWRDCRSTFVANTLPKWQQTTVFDTMREYDPGFDLDLLEPPPDAKMHHVQWLEYFDRSKWQSRELMVNVKIPKAHKVSHSSNFTLPERIITNLAKSFPELHIGTVLPREGFDADGVRVNADVASGGSSSSPMDIDGMFHTCVVHVNFGRTLLLTSCLSCVLCVVVISRYSSFDRLWFHAQVML
jgi:hypothetical protein